MARWVDVRGVISSLFNLRIRMPQLWLPAVLPRGMRYVRQIGSGYHNACFLERCADWVLPYWAGRQECPADEAFIPRAQSGLAYNQTNRNWTVVGPAPGSGMTGAGSIHRGRGWPGATVDPRGMITPFRGGWSLDFWLDIDGELYTPMQAQSLRQHLGHSVPEVHTVWQAGPVNVRTVVVAFKTGTFPWLGCSITLTPNLEETGKEARAKAESGDGAETRAKVMNAVRLLLVIRPYNPEGFAPLKSVKYSMDGLMINGRLALLATEFPDRVLCTDGTRGDGVHLIDGPKLYAAESAKGLAHAVAAFTVDLGGSDSDQAGAAQALAQASAQVQAPALGQGQSQSPLHSQVQSLEFFVPLGRMEKGFRPTPVSRQVFLSDLRHEWQEQRSTAMRVTLPEQRLNEAVQANLAYALTFAERKAGGGGITKGGGGSGSGGGGGNGDGGRTTGTICGEQPLGEQSAERAILAAALDGWGLHQAAGRVIEQMLGIDHTRPSRIVRGSLARVEQAIWALQKHSMLVINDAMLKNAYDHIAVFFSALRRFGVSNNGKSGSGRGVLRLRRLWNAAALRDASLLAQRYGKKETADGLRQAYAEVHASIAKDILRAGQAPDPVTDLMAIDPLGLIAPDAGADAGLIDGLLKNVAGLGMGLDAQGQALCYNPRMSGYDLAAEFLIMQCLIMMQDHQAYASLDRILTMALSTYAWPCAVHPRTGGGSFGEGHDPLVTALFLRVIRSILIREENDALVLGAAFPTHWYEPGTVITVDNAPSSFGTISYRIEAGEQRVELQLEGDYRFPPQSVRWNVPFAIKSALVNDRKALHREHTILLLPQTRKVVLSRE